MTSNQLIDRTKVFSYNCIQLCLNLPATDLGRHVSRQLMRAATSMAANYRAACRAQSKAAFIAKLNIPIEESDECIYWLTLALDMELADREKCSVLTKESDEILSILIASQKTARDNLNKLNQKYSPGNQHL